MNQLLSVIDDKLVIDNLRLKWTEGNQTHLGNVNIRGGLIVNQSVTLEAGATVAGELTVETLRVKNIVTDSDSTTQLDAYTFSANNAADLDGKGLLWHEPTSTHQFVFKNNPRKIFSSNTIDLHRSATYQIDGVNVVTSSGLGESIVHSKLKTVGVLESLSVSGNAILGESVFVNSSLGRLGVNTDQPNGALSVVDELVEVVIGAYDESQAFIGTWGNNTLNIGTDNTSRISIQGNTVSFGSSKYKNADVKIYGRLQVDELVADTRIERSTPIEFTATATNSVFGKGMIWVSDKPTKQFILLPNPDRLHSTESIGLESGKEFLINGNAVLRETGLGEAVQYSSLTSVGTLSSLTVAGQTNLLDQLVISEQGATFTGSVNLSTIISDSEEFKIRLQETDELVINSNGNIQLGAKENTNRVVSVYGKLAVNVSNPRADAKFIVEGDVVINGKKQTHGDQIPTEGTWTKGDIVWNIDPQETSYIGWVCVMTGTPGTWKPFGYIGER